MKEILNSIPLISDAKLLNDVISQLTFTSMYSYLYRRRLSEFSFFPRAHECEVNFKTSNMRSPQSINFKFRDGSNLNGYVTWVLILNVISGWMPDIRPNIRQNTRYLAIYPESYKFEAKYSAEYRISDQISGRIPDI